MISIVKVAFIGLVSMCAVLPGNALAGVGYVEDFEADPVGPMTGAGPSGFTGGYITDVDPIEGTRSAVHVSDGTGIGGFEMSSPDFGPAFGSVSASVRVTGTGSFYQFILLDLGNFFFVTRINFETDGRITIGQTNPDPDITGFQFFDTGFTWAVDVPLRLCLTNDPDGTLTVFVDDDLALLGRSAAQVAFENGDTATPAAGIGRYMTFTDNVGLGDIDDQGDMLPANDVALGTGDNLVVDDFSSDCATIPDLCPADTDDDGDVDIDDIVNVILDFGTDGAAHGGDVDGSGVVDVDDIVLVVLSFGPCPVVNETCADAAYVFFEGSTAFFSGLANEAGPFDCVMPDPTTNDVWFRYVVSGGGCGTTLTIDTIGSAYDTVLEVYDGHACLGSLLACDDDGAAGSPDPADSEVTIEAGAGQMLTIRVGGRTGGGPDTGAGTMNITEVVSLCPPPANDDCLNAEVILALPFTTNGETVTATGDSADSPVCGTPILVFGSGPGVWYRVQGTGETMTASLCATDEPWDSIMHVLCGDTTNCSTDLLPSSLLCAQSDDDGCGTPGDGTLSEVTWCSSATQSYMIYIGGFQTDDTGNFSLEVTSDGAGCAPAIACTVFQPDLNDFCADAQPIGQGLTAYSTIQATTDGPPHLEFCGDLSGDGGQTTEDIWFVYTAAPAAVPQYLLVSTCEDIGGSATHDTDIKLYEGTSCDVDDLNANIIACNDDDPANVCGTGGGGFHSTVTVEVTPGQEYLFRLGGWFTGNTGTGMLLVSQFEPGHDFCDFATPLTADGSTTMFDTSVATSDVAPLCSGGFNYFTPGIWLTTVGDGTTYTITTCSVAPAAWDTRLVVYCGGCDDLACISEESDNALACGPNETLTWCTFPGFEYTILLTGVGGASGTVDVTLASGSTCADPACLPPDECGGDAYQPRTPADEAFVFATSDVAAGIERFESFTWPGGPITGLRWWGIDARLLGGSFIDCADAATGMLVVLHEDDGTGRPALPGIIVYDEVADGPVTIVDDDVYDSNGTLFQDHRYTTPALTPFDPTVLYPGSPRYYLSIRDADGDACLFRWLDSPVGDGESWVIGPMDTEPQPFGVDLSFCIDPAP